MVVVSLTNHGRLRKIACIFAGLGHLQPLLLATTNSHYILDRFCMERCCSGEYVSRIVTSMIFMEILATLLVDTIAIVLELQCNPSSLSGQDLNNWSEGEEKWRGRVSTGIQFIILLGYVQIFHAFVSGGRKGHMHWFYSSLILQYFFICLIAGAIGFWDVGHALWYLMAIPVGPVVAFFYQMIIHSWIRSHGPRDAEYLVVEWQIGLALCISILATTFWAVAYYNPIVPIELNLQDSQHDRGRIPGQSAKDVIILTISGKSGARVAGTAALSPGKTVKITLDLKTLAIQNVPTLKSVKVLSVTRTLTLTGVSGAVTITIDPVKSGVLDKPTQSKQANTPTLTGMVITGSTTLNSTVTIKPDITLVLEATLSGGPTGKVYTATVTIQSATATSDNPAEITLTPTDGASAQTNEAVKGYTYSPKEKGYCIFSVKDSTNNNPDIWAGGGKHVHATYYYKKTTSANIPALLCLSVYSGDKFSNNMFFGKTANNEPWKSISEDCFIEKLKELATPDGSFTLTTGQNADQYNRNFDMVLFENWRDPSTWWPPSQTWFPLLMQGLSVGAVGSIFPNLIPKTLTCPKTTRTLTVWSIFLSPVPHVINLALADNGWPRWSPGNKWDENLGWPLSWLLYIFYILAILFAIFNVHYPEWRLSSWIRRRTWFVFLMTLFTNVLNEVFNAISRGGIMTQRSAKNDPGSQPNKLLNHPLLWNKMACLMSLSYLPFWLTTTPMMKSYVSSLDPFLCDKDRDHWPTARYGRMKSFGYWCKCACRGLYNSPRKLVTLNMRKALTRKDPPFFYTILSMDFHNDHYNDYYGDPFSLWSDLHSPFTMTTIDTIMYKLGEGRHQPYFILASCLDFLMCAVRSMISSSLS